MQASLFLLVAALVLRSGGVAPPWPLDSDHPWLLLAIVVGGTLGAPLLAGAAGFLPWNRRGADAEGSWSRRLRRMRWTQTFVCAVTAGAIAGLGWLDLVRRSVGDLILVDEALALLPAICGMLLVWWVLHPAAHMPHRGEPPPGRLRAVVDLARLQFPLLLVPVALVIAAQESAIRGAAWLGLPAELLATVAAIAALLAAPALMILALDTAPLPQDEAGESVRQVFRAAGVRVAGLRVWRTGGAMMNGMAVGLVPWCRWVLLTDLLMQCLPARGVMAVAAHEAGHLRQRHMLWLAAALVGGMGCAAVAVSGLVETVWPPEGPLPAWVEAAGTAAAVVVGAGIFGAVSRRCERQADAFAVQVLSGGADAVVTEDAVQSMRRALAVVAMTNGIPPGRRSFRHGSIRSRRERLERLTGLPCRRIPIDREMRMVKLVVAAMAAASLAAAWLESAPVPGPPATCSADAAALSMMRSR